MTANLLTNVLLKRIPKHFPARVWRQNVIAAKRGDQFIRAGAPGMADISGIIRIGDKGYRLEIEVKIGRDDLSQAQIKFQNMIVSHGGIYLVARDADVALNDLQVEVDRRSACNSQTI